MVVSTVKDMVLYYVDVSSDDVRIVKSAYVMRHTSRYMTISSTGRLFVLDSSDDRVEEVVFRHTGSKESVMDKIKGILRMKSDVQCRRARDHSGHSGDGDWARVRRMVYEKVELVDVQIDIDDTRNVLYQLVTYRYKTILSDEVVSVVRVYDLGDQSNDYALVVEIDSRDIIENGIDRGKIPYSYDMRCTVIQNISVVSIYDSEDVKLILFMKNGYRMYVGWGSASIDRMDNVSYGHYRHVDRPTHRWYVQNIVPPLRVGRNDLDKEGSNKRYVGVDSKCTDVLEYGKYVNRRFLFNMRQVYEYNKDVYKSDDTILYYTDIVNNDDRYVCSEYVSCVAEDQRYIKHDLYDVHIYYSPINNNTTHTLYNDDHIYEYRYRGYDIDVQYKHEYRYYSSMIRQLYSQPEVCTILSHDTIHVSFILRPMDILMHNILQYKRHTTIDTEDRHRTVFTLVSGIVDVGVVDCMSMMIHMVSSEEEVYYTQDEGEEYCLRHMDEDVRGMMIDVVYKVGSMYMVGAQGGGDTSIMMDGLMMYYTRLMR